ncbi:MAG: hypothetical protein AAGL11_01740 [Pseudomonadota bacterium]
MIRALALISVSLIVFLVPDASSDGNFLNNSKGKNFGLRADLCFDAKAPTCHSYFVQNVSNAEVARTTIRVRNTLKDDDGNVVCRRGKDDVVKVDLSAHYRFRARLDTRCTYYVRFKLETCKGDNDATLKPFFLNLAREQLDDPTIVLTGKCDVFIKFDEVET